MAHIPSALRGIERRGGRWREGRGKGAARYSPPAACNQDTRGLGKGQVLLIQTELLYISACISASQSLRVTLRPNAHPSTLSFLFRACRAV
jgi:hypothetical protein